jgi:hypothetical protein
MSPPRDSGERRRRGVFVKKYSMSTRHAAIMLLCCLVPLGALFLISAFDIPLSTLATGAVVLLCPLLHVLMMRGMHGHNSQGQASCHGSSAEPARPAALEEPTRPLAVKEG